MYTAENFWRLFKTLKFSNFHQHRRIILSLLPWIVSASYRIGLLCLQPYSYHLAEQIANRHGSREFNYYFSYILPCASNSISSYLIPNCTGTDRYIFDLKPNRTQDSTKSMRNSVFRIHQHVFCTHVPCVRHLFDPDYFGSYQHLQCSSAFLTQDYSKLYSRRG